MRIYRYVGPQAIRQAATGRPGGVPITSRADLARWLEDNREALNDGATFVVDLTGRLRLAPRRSEHVQCASGEPVLAAGEMRFVRAPTGPTVVEVSNQSTGYCPEPESWSAVAEALAFLGIEAPRRYTTEFVFRYCVTCGQLNVVKEGWFYCAVCDAPLPTEWNIDRMDEHQLHHDG